MIVPERTPDRPWAAMLRRAAFAATAVALTVAFALSLSGIASTQGQVPDDQAAALAAQRARAADASAATGRHHCRRGERQRGGESSGRV
jgi:hypothetical protein